MNHCHVCETDTDTYGEMDPGRGVVLKCCVCKAAVRVDGPPASAAAAAVGLAVATVAPMPLRAPRPDAPLTASALLAATAARRAAVGAALAEMASLQAEALVLDRILAAAEPLN